MGVQVKLWSTGTAVKVQANYRELRSSCEDSGKY